MNANNFTILLRGLWRRRSFSLLNILGLAIGIAAGLLIFVLIRYELGIDDFHRQRNDIYRVVSTETYRNGLVDYDGCAPVPLPDALRSEFSEPATIAAVSQVGQLMFTLPAEKQFRTGGVYFADSALFRIFNFPWIAGDVHTSLTEPFTMVITRSLANTWFGDWKQAMGKTILTGNERRPYKITGIMEDLPENTDIRLKVVLSYAGFRILEGKRMNDPQNWDNFNSGHQCFFVLKKGARIESMNARLPSFVARHYTPLFAGSDTRDSSYFQPLKAMHFDQRFSRYGNDGWSYTELFSMGLVGVFLLLVACINFVNLSTAQSLGRGKEVGMRKILGSNARQLFVRLIAETLLLLLGALLLGLVLAWLSLPSLKNLLEKNVSFDWFSILFLVVAGIVVTLMAGFYPAWALSRFNPLASVKNKMEKGNGAGLGLRRGLIIGQFVIAQLLVIGTLVIVDQLHYFRNRPMGFDRAAISLVSLPANRPGRKAPVDNAYFKSTVERTPGVLSASLCSDPPSTGGAWQAGFTFNNHPHPEDFELVMRAADTGYEATFHIGLAAGRFPYPSDSIREVMLNENAVHRLGFGDVSGIIGKFLKTDGLVKNKPLAIVGVLHDFNQGPLREKLKPLLMYSVATDYNTLAIKLDPARLQPTMASIRQLYATQFPGAFWDAEFFDDTVVNFYQGEAIASTLFKIFAGLAIIISCLGLYGLVSFMTVQKTKEVGVRKVLGASVFNIIYLFSKEFTLLVVAAFLLAAPLGYFLMRQWLSGFYYHTDLTPGIFTLAIGLSLLIAWSTVAYKAIKAALANPVKSLRTE